jgi:hypothetical protein
MARFNTKYRYCVVGVVHFFGIPTSAPHCLRNSVCEHESLVQSLEWKKVFEILLY